MTMLTPLHELASFGTPNAPAVTYQDRTVTYGEFTGQVSAAAAGLQRLGLRPGERVVLFLEKRIETVVAAFAVAASGGVFVPVNPVFKPQQVRYVAGDCDAMIVITTPERLRAMSAELAAVESIRHIVLVGDSDEMDGAHLTWDELCSYGPGVAVSVRETDPAAIMYTSGSTGKPKGVVLSHRNLVVGAQSVASYLEHTSDDVVLSVLPLSFDAGLSQLTTALVVGAHVVLVNYLLPREVVRLCAKHRVTALTCVPPLWMQLVSQSWPADVGRQLRYFANTGGHMPRPTLAQLRERFPKAKPYLMYGLTEAFRSTYLDPEEVDRRLDSIGKAIPNAEILVVRPDGTPCAPGEHGEIVHRGALVAMGYWNDPERTALRFRPLPSATEGGEPEIAVWSGDTAYTDEDGFIYFVGRTDDMIKTSGYRVSPSEIEDAAYGTGLVTEAAAFGIPDERLGQQVVLAVAVGSEQKCDTETLLKALRVDLPGYMVPGQVIVLPRLPRSGNGKFDRTELRAMFDRPELSRIAS